jgi:hypothetical protein
MTSMRCFLLLRDEVTALGILGQRRDEPICRQRTCRQRLSYRGCADTHLTLSDLLRQAVNSRPAERRRERRVPPSRPPVADHWFGKPG